MQVGYIGYRVKGFLRTANRALYWSMITKTAEDRLKMLAFWDRHGLAAAQEAFRVSRRTLYLWKAQLQAGDGKPHALNPGSTRPQRVRKRQWPALVIQEIRRQRQAHPNLGKDKLHPALRGFCAVQGLACPSERTIGRLIADAKDRMRVTPVRIRPNGQRKPVTRSPKTRKPKGFIARHPGHCVGLDSIERMRQNTRRHLVTHLDQHSRFGFAVAVPSHTSQWAKNALDLAEVVFPFTANTILTDNGSEFARHFAAALKERGTPHWHTYPRTPKMNAHCERFNRTIQEEFVDYHEDLLFTDLKAFNDKLFEWLLWYNNQRPHHALGNQTPIQIVAEFLSRKKCKMYWPHTPA